MPLPLIPMLALTGAKMAMDSKREQRQRKLQAETTRYSPWTGMQATAPQEADPLGTALQAYGGYEMGQQAEADLAGRNKLRDAQINWLDRGNSQSMPGEMVEETSLMSPKLQIPNDSSWLSGKSPRRFA